MTLRIAGIVYDSIVDGPGMRTALFVQGCPHHCKGCHNSHTFDFEGGTEVDADDVARLLKSDNFSSGVTFSGGEPMCQPKQLAYIARQVKKFDKNILIFTGYTLEFLLRENDPDRMDLLSVCDILIDGPYIESERDLTMSYRGSRNQRILDCQKSLLEGRAVAYDGT